MGPLDGVRVVEIAAIGPGPFAGMMLAGMGAEVLRIDRARPPEGPGAIPSTAPLDLLNRGRRSVGVDLKHPEGPDVVLRLVERADAFVEGFRPGVTERLGIGPDVCLARNPRLVYGRMTGWGQDGPLAQAAGHDLNYVALAGALHAIGRAGGPPVPPLNLVADMGGGGMLLAFGVACALLEVARSGRGQVVDAAMVDGVALLLTMVHSFMAMGEWSEERGTNLVDSGAPFYDVYETADGRWISVAPLEPEFWDDLVRRLGLEEEEAEVLRAREDRSRWPRLRALLAEVFRQRSRDEWCARLEGTDSCFAPVLSVAEAPRHQHNLARGTFAEVDGVVQAAAAPRLSRTPGGFAGPPPRPGQHTDEALASWGFTSDEVRELRRVGAIA